MYVEPDTGERFYSFTSRTQNKEIGCRIKDTTKSKFLALYIYEIPL
jgi:hypothetical protein